jgi:hypothetical protein
MNLNGIREVLVLTPAIDGADGISEVSRQFVAALDGLAARWRRRLGARGRDPSDRPLGRAPRS